ncbi:MAG: large protein [Pedosphaera sp.]|nr:large protein [Pedosphaera sp.]
MKKILVSLWLFALAASVFAAPVITSAPQSRSLRVGDKVTFVVGATGTTLTYLWSFNGTPIPSATAASYTLASAQLANAGNYSVLITDSTTATTSASTSLTVSTALLHLFPTNLVVLRAGDGVAALATTGNSLFLDQLTTNGTYVSTVTIPDSGTSSLVGFNSLSDHYLNSAGNNRAVLFGGFNVTKPFGSSLGASTALAAPRGIGTVNGLGYYSLAVSDTSSIYNSQFMKGVTSTDGLTQFWTSGGSGTVYVAPSLGPDTVISSGGRSSISIYNSVLYVLVGGSINQFGGLPTTATTASQVVATTGNCNDFALSPDGLTIYEADGSNLSTAGGGVRRYDNNGGTWTLSYNFTNITATATGNNGPDGIAVDFSGFTGGGATGTGAVIYATSSQATLNSLVRIVDNGYTTTPAPIIYAAGVNQVIRGVRFAPVADAPSIVTQPASVTNAPGATVTFTVAVSGSAPFTYQWKKNGTNLTNVGNISGANTATLQVSSVALSDSGNYSVVVSNDLNSATSANAALSVVVTPLAIIQQPQNLATNYGATATFSVGVSGNPPFTYQWSKDGSNLSNGPSVSGATISGATSSVLSIAGVALGDAGSYSVVVTGSGTNSTSSNATLTVADPYIVTQPVSRTNATGGTAIFTVAAGGTPPLNYTWYKNGTASIFDDGRISGVDTATLTIPALTTADAGVYTAHITGGSGITNSVDVTLTVIVSAAITSGPESRSVRVGDKVIFAVGATGTGIAYQWSFNSSPISGATANSYSILSAQLTNAGNYSVQVSNFGGSTNASATLTVSAGLLHLAPTNLVILRAGDGVAALANTGNSLFLDQITTNGAYVSTITIPDSGSTALIGNNALTDHYLGSTTNRRAVVFGGFNTTKPFGSALGSSTAAAVPRGIGTVNGLGYYSLAVSDTNSLYNGQFLKGAASTDGLTQFWTVGGAGVTYTPPLPDSDVRVTTSGGRFAVGIYNNDLYACLNGGLFHFNGLPTVATAATQLFATTNPDDFVVSPDGNTIYLTDGSNLATGGGVQRWDFDAGTTNWVRSYILNDMPGGTSGNNGPYGVAVDFSNFTGGGAAGTGAIVFAMTGVAAQNSVVRINDVVAGSSSSVIYTVGAIEVIRGIRFAPVADPVSIATQPQSQSAASGASVTFSVVASGSAPFSYQWLKGASPVIGATNSTLTLTNLQATDAGSYSVTVTNDISATNSTAVALTVTGQTPRPVISSVVKNGSIVTVTWTNVVNGATYRLQSNTSLGNTNWLDIAPDVTATNATASKNDTASGSQKFYRVVVP